MNTAPDNLARGGSAFALIVGIGEYQDKRIPKLNFTHADARGFYELLTDPRHAGFPKENVRLLIDAEATEKQIKKSVTQWLYNQVAKDSTVMIFFAGHGGQEMDKCDPDTGKQAYYFLPWDADPEDLANTGISQSDFERLLRTLRAQRMVVFLDACHSTGVAKPGARDLTIVAAPDYRQLAAQGEGRVVIAAAKPEQRSWEDQKLQHGIFTYHLLEALRGKADANGDGYVSIQEVAAYLQREVPRTVKLLGKEPQDPTFICEMARDIILTVDAERVKQRAKEQSEAEQRRIAEMSARRVKLVEMRNRNELPVKEFAEAMLINEKSLEELTPTEKLLKGWLDMMLAGNLSPELYVQTREKIYSETAHFPKPKPQRAPPLPPPQALFCIYCGSRNTNQNVFCISCGKRLK